MRTQIRFIWPALLFGAGLSAACEHRDSATQDVKTRSAAQQLLAQAPEAAESVVNEYLRRATPRMSVSAEPDSLFACDQFGSGNPELVLAKHRLLGSEMRGDTVVVRAAVVSVAQVRLKEDGYEVEQGIRDDTLSWSVIKNPSTDRWGICGFSREGPDFLRIQYLDSRTTWRGGATLQSVQRLADSIAMAR